MAHLGILGSFNLVEKSSREQEETDGNDDTEEVSEYKRKYSRYLTWNELFNKHEELIRESPVFSSDAYTHPFARILEERPTLWQDSGMNHFGDISNYPEFVLDVEGTFGVCVVGVARGGMHMVAATRDGRVFTVGSNEYGALGRPTLHPNDPKPNIVQFPFTPSETDPPIKVSAGYSHSAALYKGQVYVWGTFCDESGAPFGLIAESEQKIYPLPVKLDVPIKITNICSGDNHLALHSIEERCALFTLGSSLDPIGRHFETRAEDLRTFTLREFLLTPLPLLKYGHGDFLDVRAHAKGMIVYVVMRSPTYAWANPGKFFVFGEFNPTEEGECESVPIVSSTWIEFQVTNRKPRRRVFHERKKHLIEYLPPFTKRELRVLSGSEMEGSVPTPNGFVDTVLESYCQHHNLVLRPDDILTAILVQLTLSLNGLGLEKVSRRFGPITKSATVDLSGVDPTSMTHDQMTHHLLRFIETNWGDEALREVFHPSFTTTTLDDVIVNGLIPMAHVKKPWDYDLCVICGIPNVTLLGTQQDWFNLRQRIELLARFELEEWLVMLRPILDQFLKTRLGEIDLEFWRQICHFETGYGGPKINGWITVFSAFSEYGEFRRAESEDTPWLKLAKGEISPGFVQVDARCGSGERIKDGTMIVGHVGKKVLGDGVTLQPKSGWTLFSHQTKTTTTTNQ